MLKLHWLFLALISHTALANDLDALALADQTQEEQVKASDMAWFIEGALGQARLQNGRGEQATQRLSFDLRLDKSLATDWRVVLADRLDLAWQGWQGSVSKINTLKEAFLSWQPQPDWAVDLGRINTRYGVAQGYNPSDFFRNGALRSVVSVAPASLRENRQGTVMLRGQKLWSGGAITAILAPKLAEQASHEPFSPDWGASNPQTRYLLALSQQGPSSLAGQMLLFGEADTEPQLGFNLSGLLNDATVLYSEFTAGKETAMTYRMSSGFTWTSAYKLSLSLEYQYDGGAKNAAEWQALQQGPLSDYWRYRSDVQSRQALNTQQATMLYASWPDLLPSLELAALWRHDLIDSSDMAWFEARYHFKALDLAVQWQINRGDALSVYGALPQRQSGLLLAKYYF
ncbi:hypothetical protein [Iodobacter sp.]|uniref:hypothetical protein n=1 Tax=Iodobacter sp. TaxID=1915058 RepID=UPI0025DE33D7|nr:hypothetical protein [Iodobacter sp.]